jgi:hypothetical protein
MNHSLPLGLATIALATSASTNATASIPSGRSRFEARLTNVQGTVDVVSPRQHVASADEVLVEEQRARVRESSTATLSMRGGAVLPASELTELHLYRRSPVLLRRGPPAPRETAMPNLAFTWSERVRSPTTTWRVQVSRSATFAAVDADATGVTAPTFTAPGLRAGTYFVRVRGTDADGFEGPWSNTGRVTGTVLRVHPARDERLARLELPPGSRCGLDTSPIAFVLGSLELSPDRDHVLRCVHREGGEPSTLTIPLSECGPLRHAVYSPASTHRAERKPSPFGSRTTAERESPTRTGAWSPPRA